MIIRNSYRASKHLLETKDRYFNKITLLYGFISPPVICPFGVETCERTQTHVVLHMYNYFELQ